MSRAAALSSSTTTLIHSLSDLFNLPAELTPLACFCLLAFADLSRDPGRHVPHSAQAARDEVLAYTQERKQFGKPLVDFQAVQLRLAEMEMKTTAARLLIHAAAARADNDAIEADDGVTVFPTVSESSLAKCFSNSMAVVSQPLGPQPQQPIVLALRYLLTGCCACVCLLLVACMQEVVESAMICMGGYGYSTAFSMERRMRDVLGWRVAGGSVDIQKVNITAGMVGRRFDQRR